jgi:hypothetical protein
VSTVDDVIVERDDHERRVGHDAFHLARVEREILHWLPRAKRPETFEHVIAGQEGKGEV